MTATTTDATIERTVAEGLRIIGITQGATVDLHLPSTLPDQTIEPQQSPPIKIVLSDSSR